MLIEMISLITNALIEIKNLTKNFGDNPAVINNLDLTVQDGEYRNDLQWRFI